MYVGTKFKVVRRKVAHEVVAIGDHPTGQITIMYLSR